MKKLSDDVHRARAIQRFFSNLIVQDNGCWTWKAATKKVGGLLYGTMWTGFRKSTVHRYSYELLRGIIPEDKEIDHLCRNTLCANPYHLEAVTHKENVRRGKAGEQTGLLQRSKTHCPYGHIYDEHNTYHYFNKNKQVLYRHCRACHRKATKEYQDRNKLRVIKEVELL